jgi:hypothetical protein
MTTYYPAHASLPVDQLRIPGPSATKPSAELMADLVAALKARLDAAHKREVTRLGEDCAELRAAVDEMTKGRAA